MNIVVVYESLFGNSRKVAEAIVSGIKAAQSDAEVLCVRADRAKPSIVERADLLVVGGPTHNMGTTSARSRQMGLDRAKQQGLEDQIEPQDFGIREWLAGLEDVQGTLAATFDTCTGSFLSGHASSHIFRRLKAKGYSLVDRPISFVVGGTFGPLADDEISRARSWGATLATSM